MENLITEKLRLLKETKDYYIVNPLERRCIDQESRSCAYSPEKALKPNSDGCAIGRLIPRELAIEFDKLSPTGVSEFIEEIPSNLSNLGEEFLSLLQCFHDYDGYWGEKGLTLRGQFAYDKLRRQIFDKTI